MKLPAYSQHLILALVFVLALAATVALQVAHVDVPPLLQYVDSAAGGALFGVTAPGSAAAPADGGLQ
jgi:hypothetical protein